MNTHSRRIVDGVKKLAFEISQTGDIDDGYRKCSAFVLKEALRMAESDYKGYGERYTFLKDLAKDLNSEPSNDIEEIKEILKEVLSRLSNLE